MGKVEDYKAGPPKVIGVSTINHATRVKMQLGCMEYVLMDCIVWLLERNKLVTDVTVWERTGLHPQEQTMALESLVKKGFVMPTARADGAPHVTEKWGKFFQGITDEFDEFWTIDGKNCWTGSKPKALALYVALRKKAQKEFIINQRDQYFNYLELVRKGGFDRPTMMATVFLGAQERYNEPWATMADEVKKKQDEADKEHPEAAPSTTTQADRKKKYEDNE